MSRTPAIIGSLLLAILLISSFVTLVHVSSGENKSSLGSKEGDRVYVDDANSYISASPHTLRADSYVYLNVTSKAYGGAVDFCFGFDSNLAYPISLEVYDPHVVTTPHELNLTAYLNSPECRVDYNFSQKEGKMIYDGYFKVDYNATIFEEVAVNASSLGISNQTDGIVMGKRAVDWEWQTLFSEHFDVGDLETGVFYWKTAETVNWTTLHSNLSSLEKETFQFYGYGFVVSGKCHLRER